MGVMGGAWVFFFGGRGGGTLNTGFTFLGRGCFCQGGG
jgi:hypothetical protein